MALRAQERERQRVFMQSLQRLCALRIKRCACASLLLMHPS
jgi:hypothetical protein